jgi:hypothetical protein
MKYAVEIGSVAMIHLPSFIVIGSIIRKFMGEIFTDTQYGDLIGLLLFFSKQER